MLVAALPASAQVSGNQGLVVRDDSLGAGKGQVVQPGFDNLGQAADYLAMKAALRHSADAGADAQTPEPAGVCILCACFGFEVARRRGRAT